MSLILWETNLGKMILNILLLLVSLADCARILAILPIPVRSHYVVMEPLLQALAARGHQLTVYSSFPQKTPLPNFTDVDCSQGREIFVNNQDFRELKISMSNTFKSILNLLGHTAIDCDSVFEIIKHEEIKNKKIDLLITEMFASDCYVHFAYKLDVPLVSFVTMSPLPWTPDIFGIPDNPSYIPNCLTNLQLVMNLHQRITNTVVLMYAKMVYHFYASPRFQRSAENFFQERLPWVEDVARTASLLLVNNHFSLTRSRPLPPNVVDVGGIHIQQSQPLPMDLQDILDNSPQGVILLSFGSIIRVSTIPKEKLKIILRVFSKLSHTVVMKYEENLPDAPKNVIIRKWLPQRDILEHRNVVAFVSHCGMASITEAVYFAKPVVGFPVFADQYLNINSLVWNGAGISIDLESMTEEDFGYAIEQVLKNATYTENMKRLSQQFRDRPMTALQSAVYWTEYVLRHKGAPHLRPASTSLAFYQLWLLDVIAVIFTTLICIIVLIYYFVKCMATVVRRNFFLDVSHSKKTL